MGNGESTIAQKEYLSQMPVLNLVKQPLEIPISVYKLQRKARVFNRYNYESN